MSLSTPYRKTLPHLIRYIDLHSTLLHHALTCTQIQQPHDHTTQEDITRYTTPKVAKEIDGGSSSLSFDSTMSTDASLRLHVDPDYSNYFLLPLF